MVLTKPSTTEPMTVWVRQQPHESTGDQRAHLTPLCQALLGRLGTPYSVTATHLRDRSYWSRRACWSWAVRIEHPLARRRRHTHLLLCSFCLDIAVAEGLIPEPPLAPWIRKLE
jgi:hypothetical protein